MFMLKEVDLFFGRKESVCVKMIYVSSAKT